MSWKKNVEIDGVVRVKLGGMNLSEHGVYTFAELCDKLEQVFEGRDSTSETPQPDTHSKPRRTYTRVTRKHVEEAKALSGSMHYTQIATELGLDASTACAILNGYYDHLLAEEE